LSAADSTWFSPGQDTARDGQVSNPFDSVPVARRYAAGRPYYHRTALDLAAGRLAISRVRVALDVACGTGLSSRALSERADQVLACDASVAMLRAAEPVAGVSYFAAGAEQLPLLDASVDLATVGAAFHWFDQRRAFAELARVLRPGAGLVVYSDFFHGRVEGQPAFAEWLKNSYLPNYPTPARHSYFNPDAAESFGFTAPLYDESEIVLPLTCAQLADYMISQSNAAIAIESGRISTKSLRDYITSEAGEFFPADLTAEVVFGVRVWTCARGN
jgi:SAM-dependent methyltransferase